MIILTFAIPTLFEVTMRKKNLLLLSALTLQIINVSAQSLYEQNFRIWDEKPLTWEEFQPRHTPDDAKFVSDLSCGIQTETKNEKIGNFRFPIVTSSTKMNKISSWYDPDKCTDWTLRYEQTRFNIMEVMRRRMQNSYNNNILEKDLGRYYDELIQSTMNAFDMESNYGTDTIIVERYEKEYRDELETLKEEPIKAPIFDKSNWGMSFTIGADFEKYGSPVSEGLTASEGFTFGFGALYKRFSIDMTLSMGWSGKLQCDDFFYDEQYDYSWVKGTNVRNGNITFNGGFKLFDNSYMTVTPMVGIGVSFLDQKTDILKSPNNSKDYETSEISGLRTQAGVVFSWKIRRSLVLNTFSSGYNESKINLFVLGAKTDFKQLGNCYSINAGLVWSINGWTVK